MRSRRSKRPISPTRYLGTHSRVPISGLSCPLRVPRDLPQMAVRVLKITGVAAPECIASGLDDLCARFTGLCHNRIHFFFASHIMADGELGRAGSGLGDQRIAGNAVSPPES